MKPESGEGAEPLSTNRLTVVENVYFQEYDGQPSGITSRFGQSLESEEQAYNRKIRIGSGWQSLDCGWVEDAAQLVISNEEGKHLQAYPTEEEQAAIAAKVIEVSFECLPPGHSPPCMWEILPGQTMRGRPSNVKQILVRCRSGVARAIVFAIPR